MKRIATTLCATLLTLLVGCNATHPTGSPESAVIGGAAGASAVGLLGGSKTMMVLGGLGGSLVGYYVSTLRFASGGVLQSGGQVYRIGKFTGIYIPSDKLFEPNTADFKPQAKYILDSVVEILERNPDNNILISGNTSGFGHPKWEQRLSEKRAQRVAAYLWNEGVLPFKGDSNNTRKLQMVGEGDYLPIASNLTNDGVRTNSRIQITSYPSDCELSLNKRDQTFVNYAGLDDDSFKYTPNCRGDGGC